MARSIRSRLTSAKVDRHQASPEPDAIGQHN
jgi:hypothetical protein